MKEKKVRDGRNRVVSLGFGRFCKLKRSGLIDLFCLDLLIHLLHPVSFLSAD